MSTEKMMISVNQPYYFPFAGFFFKAYLSDNLVILDDVQFPRGTTWITRNRFKNAQGSLWMTVPVAKKGLGLQKINAVRIYHDSRWAKKHLQSLKNAYIRAPYFSEHIDFLEDLFSTKFEKLIYLNLKIIRYLMQQLRVDTNVILSSELGVHMNGDELILEICRKLGASEFLIQKAARKYINSDRLSAEGIKLKDYRTSSPVYPQLWGDFIPNLSALDLILNCGPKAHDIMISGFSGSNE
jgi:WbqC-like protein family